MDLKNRQPAFSNLTFEQAILDSLAANIAVIDSGGEILAVNAAWQEFAIANDLADQALGIGANYIDVCRSARADPNARAALKGILDVFSGRQSIFCHVYPCHSPSEERWFAMHVTPLVDHPDCVVVSHENITHRLPTEGSAGSP